MKTKYQQLTLKERYQIEILSTEGKSARSIAKQLGRGNRTISNELRRCTLGAYCAETAHTSALKNRQQAFKCTKITDDIVTTVKVTAELRVESGTSFWSHETRENPC